MEHATPGGGAGAKVATRDSLSLSLNSDIRDARDRLFGLRASTLTHFALRPWAKMKDAVARPSPDRALASCAVRAYRVTPVLPRL